VLQKLEELPVEMLVTLFRYMDPKDLFSLRTTSHFFNALFDSMLEVFFKNHKEKLALSAVPTTATSRSPP
jgi:F-box domain